MTQLTQQHKFSKSLDIFIPYVTSLLTLYTNCTVYMYMYKYIYYFFDSATLFLSERQTHFRIEMRELL